VNEFGPLFSPRTLFAMIALGLVAFGGAAYFLIYGDPATERTTGTNSFSYSAIGHRALVETLRRQEIPVRISRIDSAGRAGPADLLVVAEPRRNWVEANPARYLLPAHNVLIVLPKYTGLRDLVDKTWVRDTEQLDRATVGAVLRAVAPHSTLVRRTEADWRLNWFKATPTIKAPQLMTDNGFLPLISSAGGLLFGKIDRRDKNIWVLSDPDIFANHGLGKGENAALAVEMIRDLLPPGGSVIIDETVHGFYHSPSLWRHVFELPFVAVTLLLAAALAVLIWAAAGRFGAPLPSPERPPAGKLGLIETTARLLNAGEHAPYILKRYQEFVFRDIARRLHAPHKYGEREFDDWIGRIARARGAEADPAELLTAVDGLSA